MEKITLLIDAESLSNLYSFMGQTAGIIIALISVVALYRIQQIKEYLVGQGKAIYDNLETYLGRGYKLEGIYWDRLRGAIEVKSVPGIEEIMVRLTLEEVRTEKTGPTGFYKKAMPIWVETTKLMDSIKFLYIISIISFMATILLSVISLTFNLIFNNLWPSILLFALITLSFLIGLIFGFIVFLKAFQKNLSYDISKLQEVDELKKSNPKIAALYK